MLGTYHTKYSTYMVHVTQYLHVATHSFSRDTRPENKPSGTEGIGLWSICLTTKQQKRRQEEYMMEVIRVVVHAFDHRATGMQAIGIITQDGID